MLFILDTLIHLLQKYFQIASLYTNIPVHFIQLYTKILLAFYQVRKNRNLNINIYSKMEEISCRANSVNKLNVA